MYVSNRHIDNWSDTIADCIKLVAAIAAVFFFQKSIISPHITDGSKEFVIKLVVSTIQEMLSPIVIIIIIAIIVLRLSWNAFNSLRFLLRTDAVAVHENTIDLISNNRNDRLEVGNKAYVFAQKSGQRFQIIAVDDMGNNYSSGVSWSSEKDAEQTAEELNDFIRSLRWKKMDAQ